MDHQGIGTYADIQKDWEIEFLHSDPFDRLLMAQAASRNLRLVTLDRYSPDSRTITSVQRDLISVRWIRHKADGLWAAVSLSSVNRPLIALQPTKTINTPLHS